VPHKSVSLATYLSECIARLTDINARILAICVRNAQFGDHAVVEHLISYCVAVCVCRVIYMQVNAFKRHGRTDTNTEARQVQIQMQIYRCRWRCRYGYVDVDVNVDTCLRNVSDAMQFYNNVFPVVGVPVVVLLTKTKTYESEMHTQIRTCTHTGARHTHVAFVCVCKWHK